MHFVVPACVLLVIATTVLHYEILGVLNARLPRLPVPHRLKLLVVIFSAFVAHALEMAFYGLVLFGMVHWLDVGKLVGAAGISLASCLYFSAETYTSLGFGDVTPVGPIRLLAGVEALNGLLLIGWSASFTYISMERFWGDQQDAPDSRRH